MQHRFIGQVADALICAQTPTEQSAREIFAIGSRHARIEAAFRCVQRPVPRWFARQAERCIARVDLNGAPFKGKAIARGCVVTVFLDDDRQEVLKVYRGSIGLTGPAYDHYLADVTRDLEHMNRYYGNCEEMLVPTALHVISSPVLGMRAITVAQPYVDVTATDFFRDHDDAQLLGWLHTDPPFREQFLSFAAGLADSLADGDYCFDMHGPDNLMLVETDAGRRLLVADLGVYNLAERRRTVPLVFEEIQRRHERVFKLAEALKTN